MTILASENPTDVKQNGMDEVLVNVKQQNRCR